MFFFLPQYREMLQRQEVWRFCRDLFSARFINKDQGMDIIINNTIKMFKRLFCFLEKKKQKEFCLYDINND